MPLLLGKRFLDRQIAIMRWFVSCVCQASSASCTRVFFVCSWLPFFAFSIQQVDITEGHQRPMPVVIQPFFVESHAEIGANTLATQVREVIEADLARSGLFDVMHDMVGISAGEQSNYMPDLQHFLDKQVYWVVHGTCQMADRGETIITFRLWDVRAKKQVAERSYQAPAHHWRRIAHKIADRIYERSTGDAGYFDTRIVYVSQTGPAQALRKRIAMMDQDGANHVMLTQSRYLVLTPQLSPNREKILYVSYQGNKPHIVLRDVRTAAERVVGHFPGMSFAPRFSPDGEHILLSIARAGATNIYRLNLTTLAMEPLTSGSSINTSPSYSPDGRSIMFNSDRGGSQQLYMMSAQGGEAKRITFGGGGSYAEPVWSPRGDYIAFTKLVSRRRYIGIMRPDGSNERLLAEGYMVENPSWAPNGRVVIFARTDPPSGKRAGRTQLFSIDISAMRESHIVTPTDGSDPVWSTLLQ